MATSLACAKESLSWHISEICLFLSGTQHRQLLSREGKLNRPGFLLQLGFIPTPLTPASAPSLSPLGYMPGPATSLMLSPEGLSGSLRKAREATPRDKAGCSSEQVDYKSKGEQEAYVSYHFILLLILKYLLYPPHTALDRNAPRAQEGSTPTNGASRQEDGALWKKQTMKSFRGLAGEHAPGGGWRKASKGMFFELSL